MTTAKRAVPEVDPVLGVAPSPKVVADGKPVPKGGGRFTTGKGYKVGMRTFTPTPVEPKGYAATGMASYYGSRFHGRRTANGEVFDQYAYTAAHPTLPLPCYVRVTNLSNNRSMIVRVNDRGPFHRGRLIDVSKNAADALGFRTAGVGRVKVEYVGLASLQGSDDRKLLATLMENGHPVMPQTSGQTQIASLFQPPPPPAPPPPRAQPAIATAAAMPVSATAQQPQPALRPAVYMAAPTPGVHTAAAPAAYAAAQLPAQPVPMPTAARVSAQHAVAAARPAVAPAPAAPVMAEAVPPPSAEAPPVVVASAPAPAGNARARILLSWGGMTAPMPLSASAPDLPASATALGPTY